VSLLSGAVGALGEAWAELRAHKLRVALSLIGIAVAVGALTAVVALGEYQRQAVVEQSDRYGGRVATLSISTHSNDGSPVDWAEADRRFVRVAERYGFSHTTRVVPDGTTTLPVQLADGVTDVPARLMDPAYPVMHRLSLLEGRWFLPQDRDLLAPPVVVNEPLWDMLGRVPLDQHPTLRMGGDFAGVYPIVGVTPRDGPWDTRPRIEMLLDQYRDRLGAVPKEVQVSWEAWVPGELASEIGPVLAMDLRSQLSPGLEVSVSRTDWAAQPGFEQSFLMMQLITGGIAGIVLLLGGLSLVNIQLVAMRQRIREIGVRRSFGASGGRVFASVMLESVVATAAAGVVGIALAVAILRSPWVMQSLFAGLQDVPAFPFGAALLGLVASVAVGALAGLIPALVALRVRVIDAIRF
jgi:putative ABC transport system permease protein